MAFQYPPTVTDHDQRRWHEVGRTRPGAPDGMGLQSERARIGHDQALGTNLRTSAAPQSAAKPVSRLECPGGR